MKPLDQWAHDFGYADFDTFVRTGGSMGEAMRDIAQRIHRLQRALNALQARPVLAEPLATVETEPVAEPAIQGDEVG